MNNVLFINTFGDADAGPRVGTGLEDICPDQPPGKICIDGVPVDVEVLEGNIAHDLFGIKLGDVVGLEDAELRLGRNFKGTHAQKQDIGMFAHVQELLRLVVIHQGFVFLLRAAHSWSVDNFSAAVDDLGQADAAQVGKKVHGIAEAAGQRNNLYLWKTQGFGGGDEP